MSRNADASQWAQPGQPLYREVRRQITEAIDSNEWRPGESIPSEARLCARFGVSMGTLRKAVDELTASGVLVRKQGLGTFVGRHSHDRYLFSYFHLVGRDGHKEYPGVQFLRFRTTTADAFAAKTLSVKPGARLFHFTNVLTLRGRPTSVDEIHVPAALFRGLTEERLLDRSTTLYQMYQDQFNISVVRTAERVRACTATAEQAEVLQTEAGAPLLEIIRIVYTFQDRPVELRYSYVDTRLCEYRPQASFTHRA